MANTRKICPTWLHQMSNYLKRFYSFIAGNGTDDLNKVTREQLIQFQLYLYSEHLLAKDTVRCHIVTLRSFYNYLYLNNLVSNNPTIGLGLVPSPAACQVGSRRHYTWKELITRFKKDHYRNNYTLLCLKQKLSGINLFIKFLRTQHVRTIYKVKPIHIENYKQYLDSYYSNSSNPVFMKVLAVKRACRFLRFFYYKGYIEKDPASCIDYSQYRKELEKTAKQENPAIKEKTRLEETIDKFLSYRNSLYYRSKNFTSTMRPLVKFLSLQKIDDPGLVTKRHMLEFQKWLPYQRYGNGSRYSQGTIQKFLISAKSFWQFLVKYDLVNTDPTVVLELPRRRNFQPFRVMTRREVDILLALPDTGTILGVRDRAIFEVFYSTGMRANELSHLQPEDIDFTEGLVCVQHPKGGPEFKRVVAIGKIACEWVKKYITTARPVLLEESKSRSPYLFLSKKGNRIAPITLNEITKQYLFKAGIRKNITSHSWRITCGTFMLKNGADIRYVQEQLGHRDIRSTQGYTRLIPKDLKRIHRKFHPREIESRIKKVA